MRGSPSALTAASIFQASLTRRDQVTAITGRRAAAATTCPEEQGCPEDKSGLCPDAECIPDTPPDSPSAAVARLTPSALALLQPGAMQEGSFQQHRRVYAPASLFPGFATWEKLQVQPPVSERLQSQQSAPNSEKARQQHAEKNLPVRCQEGIAARMQKFKHILPRLPLPPASHRE